MKRRPGSGSSGRSGLFQRSNPAFPASTRSCGLPPEEGPSQIVERLREGASRRSCFPPTREPGVPEVDLNPLVRPTALDLFRGCLLYTSDAADDLLSVA